MLKSRLANAARVRLKYGKRLSEARESLLSAGESFAVIMLRMEDRGKAKYMR